MSNFQYDAGNNTVAMAVTTTSSSITLRKDSITMSVYNAGTVVVFIRWGPAPQTALVPDFPIPPGYVMVLDKPGQNTLAAIVATGTSTLYVSQGTGS